MTTDPKSGTPLTDALEKEFQQRGWRAYENAAYIKMALHARKLESRLASHAEREGEIENLYHRPSDLPKRRG